jgi:hypothetical protein
MGRDFSQAAYLFFPVAVAAALFAVRFERSFQALGRLSYFSNNT